MTVKEVFDLRKQGRIEEAYEAIRPMYAVHQGKYTTLCMFWTANDILKKRVKEQRHDEALKIFKALQRVLPNIDDHDGRAHSSMLYNALMLDREVKAFSMLDFVATLKVETLTEADWQSIATPAVAGTNGHPLPAVAQRLLTAAFHEIKEAPTIDNALKVVALLQEAMRRHPHNHDNLRHMATVYHIMGDHDKALAIERQLPTKPQKGGWQPRA